VSVAAKASPFNETTDLIIRLINHSVKPNFRLWRGAWVSRAKSAFQNLNPVLALAQRCYRREPG
jgi:hypothetical protein